MRLPASFSLLALALGCAAGPPAPAGDEGLRVGTPGDYAPFSVVGGAGFPAVDGFDLDVARAFAADTGRALTLHRFLWRELSANVRAGAFDVAMGGVTVRPERSVIGRFSVPVAESGAVVLAPAARAAGGLAALDRAGVTLGVNRGGHLERVARRRFPQARLETFPENDAVRRALAAGRVDAIVTDTMEAPHWQRTLPGVVPLGPFTRDRKAYLWAPPFDERAAQALDAWLLAREARGWLAERRAEHMGAAGRPTATAEAALTAAVGERLALMPLVAEAKRGRGGGVRDAARERRVLEAAWRAVAREAAALGVAPPERGDVEAFYRAQIELAVEVQRRALEGVAPGGERFRLAEDLRPALLRVGDRIAWLLVRLERAPAPEQVHAELERFAVRPESAARLVRALERLVQGRVKARASSPAITGRMIETP